MQVTLTHPDGSATVYTSNVAVTSNVYVGVTNPGTWANVVALFTAQSNQIFPEEVVFQGQPATIYHYYNLKTEYITDFGFNTWAKERLSAEEYLVFEREQADWFLRNSDHPYDTEPNFRKWWNRFQTDTNVILVK